MAVPSSISDIGGFSTESFLNYAVANNLDAKTTQLALANVIFETYGRSKRRFSYSESFAESAPACVSDFTRGLQHQDWIDGESVVQAGQTAAEQGFNLRFHQIEDDLDALGANVDKAFECMA